MSFAIRPETLEAIDVNADQDTAEVATAGADVDAQRIDDGSGVLVMTDVMGGTPSNCTLPLCEPGRVEVVAGISLPMLLRALTYRNDTAATRGRDGARGRPEWRGAGRQPRRLSL